MSDIKKNLKNVKTSATLAINEISNKLKKEGKKIFKFGLGQSPFPVPSILVNELKKRAHEKDYINVSGLLELRKQIAKYHSKKNKNKYHLDNIIIGPGSKELIFQIQLVLDGDLLLPNPSWVSYEPQARILQKKVHWINANAKTNWHITAKEFDSICKKSNNKNKLLILNSPNNPSGTVHDDLQSIAQVAKKNRVIILSDEIYCELNFSGSYESISHYYPEGTIISSGISKWCGAGGWRLGFFAIPDNLKEIRDSLKILASESFSSVSAPIQYAAIKAYKEDHSHYVKNINKILFAVGNYVYENLKSNKISISKPEGGFYLMPEFINVKFLNSTEMCKNILNETGVALLPGSEFGFDEKKLIARLSYTDFDGKNFLNNTTGSKKLDNVDIKKYAPNIVEGVSKLVTWSKSV